MVNFPKFLTCILLLSLVAFSAFDPADYLYPNENQGQLKRVNFSVDGSAYSLVSVNSEPIFLIKGDGPVRDQNEIRDALYSYYKKTGYPTPGELASLKDSINSYNISRNDGGRFKEKEEYVCRQILLLNGVKYSTSTIMCDSPENCTKIAQVFYSASYAKGVKKSMSFENAVALLQEFGTASFGNDKLINRAFELLDNINEDNLAQSLSEIRSSVSMLRDHKATLEDTIFRTPTTDPEEVKECIDEKCFALCPDISFNATALDLIENKASDLITKSQSFSGYKSRSALLYNNTFKRLNYLEGETKASEYISLYDPLSIEATLAIEEGNEALSLFRDESLTASVTRLEDLTVRINQSIQNRNFATIDGDLALYEESIREVRDMLPGVLAAYENSIAFKNDAEATLFVLENRDLDATNRRKVNELKTVAETLDAQFSNGLSDNQLTQMREAYRNVSTQARVLLKNEKESALSLPGTKFRAFARRVNKEIAGGLDTINVPPSDFTVNKLASFGGIAIIAFVSISALSFFVFLHIYGQFRKAPGAIRFVIVGSYVVFLFGALLFSALFYLFLDKTALAADIEEFAADVSSKKQVYIAVDNEGASSDARLEMKSCSGLLASSLRASNKSVILYELEGESCTGTNALGETNAYSRSTCLGTLKNSSAFIMRYSPTPQRAVFSSIYDTKAFITGDADYYKDCTISAVFR